MFASYNVRNYDVRKFDVRKWQMRKFNVRQRASPVEARRSFYTFTLRHTDSI